MVHALSKNQRCNVGSLLAHRPERIANRLVEHFDDADHYAKRLSTLVIQLSEMTRLRTEKRIKAAGLNLNRGEIITLTCLRLSPEPHELRQSEISDRVLLTSGGVTNICKQLLRREWLERDKDPDDARSSIYRLTESGIKVIDSVIPVIHTAEKEMASCLENQEIEQLCALLERVTAQIEAN